MRKIGILLFLIIAGISIPELCAQPDSIIFFRSGKKHEEVKIPLNDYPLKLKITGEKTMRVKITGYTDSSLSVRVQSGKRERNEIEKKYGTEAYMEIRNGHFTKLQQDSISRRADSLKEVAEYARTAIITHKEIRVLKIPNRQRPEMKRRVNTFDILGFATALAIIGSPYTKSPPVYVVVAALSLTVGVSSIATEYKQINFKNGWKTK